jgi:15-cis-phytoene synthase
MQWWRDVLSGTSESDAHAHPVARDLLQTVREHNLPVSSLQNLIDARTFDLYDDPMPDVATLEGYAGETASALIQLSSLVLDPENAPNSAEAAGHAGMAQAIAGLLLLMPLHRQRGQVYLPQTLLAATGLNRDMFLLGKDGSRIGAAVEAFAGLGRDHLDKARSLSGTISKANSLAFLPVSLASPILDRAIRLRADIFEQPLQPQQWRRQWTLWRSSRSGRF